MKRIFQFFKELFKRTEEKVSLGLSEDDSPPFDFRMKWLEKYFQRNIKNNPSFEPEYFASKEINEYALKDDISKEDILKIIEIFNKVNEAYHFDGSGWFDLRIHIQGLITRNNYSYETLPNKNLKFVESKSA